METVYIVVFCLLLVAGLLALVRAIRGPSLADRIVALDTLLFVIVCGVAAHGAHAGHGLFIDVLVAAALLGFVSTMLVARYIERRGDE